MNIENCTFNGVVWDKNVLDTVNLVARGLVNLTELFKNQHVTIDSMLKVVQDDANLYGDGQDFSEEYEIDKTILDKNNIGVLV
jgi:hypothetical protein